MPAQKNEFGYDPFGMDPQFIKNVALPIIFLYKNYFRCQVYGSHNISDQRVLLISNHSGQIPVDAMMISAAVLLESKPPRIVRSMIEKWVPTLPFISIFMSRCGQIVGTPENCRRLLKQEEAILVFPEGVKGICKKFSQRYQLQSFGYGFMRLALATNTPIVPVCVIGAEEQAPQIYNVKSLARLLNIPAFPLTPTFPWLFPMGAIPYPTKYHIYFGEPLYFEGDANEEDAEISIKVDRVKTTINRMIQKVLRKRKRIFW